MAWTEYTQPLEVLSASDVNNIKENINIIKGLLIKKGFTVSETKHFQASESTPLIEVFDILSKIEYNLDVINDNDCKSAYYREPKEIGNFASNYNDIWRWIRILNDMYEILNNRKSKWGFLVCNDGIVVINKKGILVRGDLIG